MIGQTLGHYRIVRRLGAGGMGEVYLADDQRLGRQVALKVLPEKFAASKERIERFRREATALAALDHPGIVTIYSLESAALGAEAPEQGEGGKPSAPDPPTELQFITMQYVQGEPLSALVPRQGLPLTDLLRLAVPLADAISAAHEKGVIHRDLKPSNIMVTTEGGIKVLDFGLAKLLHGEPEPRTGEDTTQALTADGRLPGTLPYMSPEQVLGLAVDHRSDVFSLGIILYQMATGEHPFRGKLSVDLASSILQDTPSSVSATRSDLPQQLDWIVNLCLQKDPDKRMQSMKDLRNEIQLLEQEISAPGAASPELTAVRKRSRLLGGLLAAVAVVAAVLGGLLVLRSLPRRAPDSGPPRFLAVEPVRSFTGGGDRFLPGGMARFVAHRLQRLEGIYLASAGAEAHRLDYRLEIDTRREAERVNLSYRLVERQSNRALGGGVLREPDQGIVALADEVGRAIADLLRSEGLAAVRFRPDRTPTRDPIALASFLTGLDHFGLASPDSDPAVAQPAFQAAWSTDPGFQLARVYDGLVLLQEYLEAEDPLLLSRAEELCGEAAATEPKLALAQLCLGEGHRLGRRPLEAVGNYRRAIDLGLRHPLAYAGARMAFVELGRPESEGEFWRRVIDTDPRFWLGFNFRSEFLLEQGRHQAALEDAQRALELAPGDPGAYLTLWNVQSEMGRQGEALQTLQRGLEVDPDDHRLWGNLGNMYFQLRRFDEAINAHRRTVSLAPEDPRAHGFLGRDYYWAPGRREDARAPLQQAIELCRQELAADPTRSDLELMLAWYQAMSGEAEAGRRSLAAALEHRPNDSHYLYVAGLIATVLEDEETALDYFERAVAGGWSVAELQTAVEVDSLRDQPRFQALLKQGG